MEERFTKKYSPPPHKTLSIEMNLIEWEPSQNELADVVRILIEAKNSDRRIQNNTQKSLDSMASSDNFNNYLFFILKNDIEGIDGYIIMMAGTILKNNIRHHYYKFSPDFLLLVKSYIVQCLLNNCYEVRLSAANIISQIAIFDIHFCLNIVPQIFSIIETFNYDISKNAFNTIERICEDMEMIECEEKSKGDLIILLIQNLLKYFLCPIDDYKYRSLKCLSNFVSLYGKEIQQDYIRFMPNFLRLLSEKNTANVIRESCSILDTLADVSFNYIKPYLPQIIQFIFEALELGDHKISLEATEFWCSLMANGGGHEYVENVLEKLIPILLKNMRYSDEDVLFSSYVEYDANIEDEEDDVATERKGKSTSQDEDSEEDSDESSNEWTLRKSSAYTLDKISLIYKTDICPYLALIGVMLQSKDWLDVEAGILAMGAIADGCKTQLSSLFLPVFPFILQSSQHPIALIRSIASWTLSRYSSFLLTLPGDSFEKSVLVILDQFNDRNKFAQKGGITALISIVETSPAQICYLLDKILQQILISIKEFKIKNLICLNELIVTIVENIPTISDLNLFKNNLMPILLEKLKYLDDKTLPYNFNLLDSFNMIVNSLKHAYTPYTCATVSTLISIINSRMSHHKISTDPIYINYTDENYINYALEILTVLIRYNSPVMKEFLIKFNIINIIIGCCMCSNRDIRYSSFECIGEIAEFCFDLIYPNADTFIKILSTFYSEDCYYVKKNAICAAGNIFLQCGPELSRYIDYIVPIYSNIIFEENATRSVLQTTIYCFSVISKNNPNEMAKYLPSLINIWTNTISRIKSIGDKEACAAGLCSLLAVDLATFSNNLYIIIIAFLTINDPSHDLRLKFSTIMSNLLSQYSFQDRDAVIANIPNSVRSRLRSIYGI